VKPVVPVATYRVQLTREFGFRECTAIVPYLTALGVSTLYCSPVLQAVPGSEHGYDTIDPTRLSPDLGGDAGWAALCDAVRRNGMTILLDIVPNHMAAVSANPWWRDVLEYGRASPFAAVFDVDWDPPWRWLKNRVMLPVLPSPLGQALNGGQLELHLGGSGLVLTHAGMELPLGLRSYRHVLRPLLCCDHGPLPEGFTGLVAELDALPALGAASSRSVGLYERLQRTKRMLLEFIGPRSGVEAGHRRLPAMVEGAVARITPSTLRLILAEQHYVLGYWKTARNHVNYRRFFDINGLVGVRVEDTEVFNLTHGFLRTLTESGVVCGLRVDHVDGLREPLRYLRKLRATHESFPGAAGVRPPFIAVEKILSGDETLPQRWPVEGTTGYDFLNEAAGLFVDPGGLQAMWRHYRRLTGARSTRAELTYENKRAVLGHLFHADLSLLAHMVAPVSRWLHPAAPVPPGAIVAALEEVTAALPVYRTYYSGSGALTAQDSAYLGMALQRAARRAGIDRNALEVVQRTLTLDLPSAPAHVRRAARHALLRWQQLSGAAMAKGFEDTTLYQDSTLLALNAVGGREKLSTTSLEHFHDWNRRRATDWPHTMNSTATHDAKRGEDVRARVSVLSEVPGVWAAAVERWFAVAGRHPASAPLMGQIDAATHLFLLQTMVGAWPGEGDRDEYAERIAHYMEKVAREAKTRSSWLEPDEAYERALAQLTQFALTGDGASAFTDCFGPVIASVAFHGLVNSVAQVLLKVMCPGLPDFYQGTELLDLSLVDPDNRRPVDYEARRSLLDDLEAKPADRSSRVAGLVSGWPDQLAKLYVTSIALGVRRRYRQVFERGDYIPLRAASRHTVCAFSRSLRGTHVVVVVPVGSRSIAGDRRLPLGTGVWGDDSIAMPADSPRLFTDALTGGRVHARGGIIRLADALAEFPVALLLSERTR